MAFKIGAKFSQRGSSAETITNIFIQQLGQARPQVELGMTWLANEFK